MFIQTLAHCVTLDQISKIIIDCLLLCLYIQYYAFSSALWNQLF